MSDFDSSFERTFNSSFPTLLQGYMRKLEQDQQNKTDAYAMELLNAVDNTVISSDSEEKGARLELGMFQQKVEDLANLDPKVRASAVDRMAEQWQQKHNKPLALPWVDFLKKSDSETLANFSGAKSTMYVMDPTMTMKGYMDKLTDEGAAIHDIGTTLKSVKNKTESGQPVDNEFDMQQANVNQAQHAYEQAIKHRAAYIQAKQSAMQRANSKGEKLSQSTLDAYDTKIDQWDSLAKTAVDRAKALGGVVQEGDKAYSREVGGAQGRAAVAGIEGQTAGVKSVAQGDYIEGQLSARGIPHRPRESYESAGALPAASDRDEKINDLVSQNVPADRAQRIVDNQYEIKINDKTGKVVALDTVGGKATEVPIESKAPEFTTALRKRGTLYEQSDDVTGAWPALKEIWAETMGQIPGVPVDAKTIEKRTAFKLAMGQMRRSMAINPRFPVGEMERLEQEIQIEPKVLDSTPALQTRLRKIDESVRVRLRQAERDAQDTGLPDTERAAQAQNAQAMRDFVNLLGVPPESFEGTPHEWGQLKPEEQRLWER